MRILKFLLIGLLGALIGIIFPGLFVFLDLKELGLELEPKNVIFILQSQALYKFSLYAFPSLFAFMFLLFFKVILQRKEANQAAKLERFKTKIISLLAQEKNEIEIYNIITEFFTEMFSNECAFLVKDLVDGEFKSIVFEYHYKKTEGQLHPLFQDVILKENKEPLIELTIMSRKKYDDREMKKLSQYYQDFLQIVGLVFGKINKDKELQIARSQSMNTAKFAALGEMAGGVAHEINNPLTVISGSAKILETIIKEKFPELIDDKLVGKNLNRIQDTVFRISKIVAGLRTFARDSKDEDFENVQLERFLEECLAFGSEKLKNNGVRLSTNFDKIDDVVEIRPVQLMQVIVNLFNNAVDAIESYDDKWINVSAKFINDAFEIRIMDSGKGISDEVQAKIFQPFYTTKPVGKGTGIGLSISLGIVRDHNGVLFLDKAAPNTCFVLQIPKKRNGNING